MALESKTRKIYDALGIAYQVGVLEGGAGVGDIQKVTLYDGDGNPLTISVDTSAMEAILTAIKDTDGIKQIADPVTTTPGTGWVEVGENTKENSIPVALATDHGAVPVSGTFWQATQPVSAAALPLPSGAATEATLSTLNGKDFATQTTLASALTALQIIDNMVSGTGANISQINGVTPLMGSGATGTGSLRVTMATNSADVTALQIMDDWDESDRAKVNLIAGQAGITAGAGAVAANTPRTTLASDDPAVAALGNLLTELYVLNGAMAMQTDVASATVTYQGWAAPGTATSAASWRIKKITESSGDYSLQFADGDRLFNNVWDNRAALSYS